MSFGIPRGIAGEDGVGISSVNLTGSSGLVDTYQITFTDNSTTTFNVTNGAAGNPGKAGPANELSIGTVTSGDSASATITGDAPDQTLNLVLPKGDKGDKGDQGSDGDTPYIDETTKHWIIGDTDTGVIA